MTFRGLLTRCLFVLFALSFVAAVALADDDHMRARQALQAGEVLPLRVLLEKVGAMYPGEVIEVELERDDGLWIYEIKLLRSQGGMLKLKVDARNGELLGLKGKGLRMRCRGSSDEGCDKEYD